MLMPLDGSVNRSHFAGSAAKASGVRRLVVALGMLDCRVGGHSPPYSDFRSTIERVASTASQQSAPTARAMATPSKTGRQHSSLGMPASSRELTTLPTSQVMVSTPTPPSEFIRPNIEAPCLPLISATTAHQVGIDTCRKNSA